MNEDLRKMLEAAREASRGLNRCQEADINRLLLSAADKVEAAIDKILAANATDLAGREPANSCRARRSEPLPPTCAAWRRCRRPFAAHWQNGHSPTGCE